MKRLLAGFAVAVVLACAGIVGGMWGDSIHPYEHDFGEIFPPAPVPESHLTVQWTYKQINRWCPGYVQRLIYQDGALVCSYDAVPVAPASQLISTRSDSAPNALTRTFKLCRMARPGPATYRAYTCYYCNPLQRGLDRPICYYTPDINFQIEAPPIAPTPRGERGEQGPRGETGPQGSPGPPN